MSRSSLARRFMIRPAFSNNNAKMEACPDTLQYIQVCSGLNQSLTDSIRNKGNLPAVIIHRRHSNRQIS
jgi:hypothetical protein